MKALQAPQSKMRFNHPTFFSRTSEQIQAEIENKLGFIPPFFAPAEPMPQVLENLWQQTLSAYLDNPLPDLFKEKLSAYLSRFCAIPYCLICHSCSLKALGMEAKEVLALLESSLPTSGEIDRHLQTLTAQADELADLAEMPVPLETSLLACSIFIAIQEDKTEACRTQLRRLLGLENYHNLIVFIAYVKTCHAWMEANPEVSYEADGRVRNYYDLLVTETPQLAQFFSTYWERAKQERQSWVQQQAVLLERQQNEEKLQQVAAENLRLARAIASTSEGILITDPNLPDNPIIYSNPAIARITGYTPEEILGRNCRFLQGADTDPNAIAQIREAIAQEREIKATLLNYRKDGQPFWNELKLSPVRSDEGQLLYFVGVQTDITAQKQAEAERVQLLEREQIARAEAEAAQNRITRILERITDSFFAVDNNWQFTYLNHHAELLLQRSKTELLGKNIWQEFPQFVNSTFEQEYRKAVTQQVSVFFEAFYPQLEAWFAVHAYPSEEGLSVYFQDITERKRNEAALLESESRFRRLVESNTIGVIVADFEGRITVANDAFLDLLGYTQADLQAGNLRWDRLTPPEYRAVDEQAIAEIQQQGACNAFEKVYRHKDGSLKPVLVGGALLDGAQDSCICIVLDQSDRKQQEEALRVTHQMLKALVVGSPLAIMTLDLEGRVQMWNPAAERIFGWTEEEVMGYPLPIVPENQQQQFWQLRQRVSQGESFTGVEVKRQKHDGSLIDISISVAPLRDATGAVNGIVAVLNDVTERKQAEQKICEQAALLDVTTDAIFVRNLQRQILFWNKSAERLYGWDADRVLGRNELEFLYAENPQQHQIAETSAIARGEWQGELNLVTQSGAKLIVQSRWTLVRDEEQKPKSILVVNTDITEKKLLESQFFRAQRMESIGTLASGIAHDLNNVLTPILTSAQLMRKANFPREKQQLLLETVESSAKRGAALIKQVLSFARGIEGNRVVLQLRHIISEIQQIATETFPRSIEIHVDVARDLWLVAGDTTQLHQVLMNLCVNARDAMPQGGKLSLSATNFWVDERYARTHLEAKVGSYIVIEVADTGTGIAPEHLDRIFEPFFTTKELGKGTGLGLSTVLGIIKSHGGFVEVMSAASQGSSFRVYLPAVKEDETQLDREEEMAIGRGELILVVDDETAICQINQTSLETYNYQAMTASDGFEAIALYAQHQDKISLVLLDLMMPGMDGVTTLRTLRKLNPHVKAIAVSGLTSSTSIAETVDALFQAFLPKPYTAKELVECINQVLRQPKIRQKE